MLSFEKEEHLERIRTITLQGMQGRQPGPGEQADGGAEVREVRGATGFSANAG